MSAISLRHPSYPAAGSGPEAPPLEDFPTALRVLGLEFSLATASIDALERVALRMTRNQVRLWFERFIQTQEAGLLTTCHRVELVLLLASDEELERWRAALPGPRAHWHLREGRELVAHLFSVAGGYESLARGEGEVRGQVAIAGSRVETRHPRRVLHEVFARAARTAGEGATRESPGPSIAAVAVSRLRALTNEARPRVLVIGSGKVGCQVAERLGTSARVTLLFHRNPPEAAFLRATGARAEPLDRLGAELRNAAVIVTAAKFGARGLRAADLPTGHPLLLIDLGMPRNIDPDVRDLTNVRLIDLEDLYSAADRIPPDGAPDRRLREQADQCYDRLESLLMEPWIGVVRRAAEQLRRAEVAKARRYLGRLDPAQEMAIDRLTQRLVARLLLAPTQKLRSLPSGPDGTLQRQWAIQLLRSP